MHPDDEATEMADETATAAPDAEAGATAAEVAEDTRHAPGPVPPGSPDADRPGSTYVPGPATGGAGVTEARMVHYVMADGIQHRPAVIVRAWRQPDGIPTGVVNLCVFLDGSNDATRPEIMGHLQPVPVNVQPGMLAWATSVHHDEVGRAAHSWHWPERA
jgi:hypothetical protein